MLFLRVSLVKTLYRARDGAMVRVIRGDWRLPRRKVGVLARRERYAMFERVDICNWERMNGDCPVSSKMCEEWRSGSTLAVPGLGATDDVESRGDKFL